MVDSHAPQAPADRKRVLLADDDAGVCALLELALESHCDVVAVHDAESAFAKLSSGTRFDAFISDFMLPGISGLELIAKIRRCERSASIPILMISGHGAYGIGTAAREAGADAFLDKPFTLVQLRAAIAALLRLRLNFA